MPPPKKRGQQRPAKRATGGSARQRSGPTPPRTRPASATQAQQSRSFYTPGGSAFRHAVERRSAPLLVLLTNGPRIVMMLLPLALLLLGLFLPVTIGLIALVLFLLFTGWLAYLSWPNADVRAKGVRALMFVLVVALIVVRVVRA